MNSSGTRPQLNSRARPARCRAGMVGAVAPRRASALRWRYIKMPSSIQAGSARFSNWSNSQFETSTMRASGLRWTPRDDSVAYRIGAKSCVRSHCRCGMNISKAINAASIRPRRCRGSRQPRCESQKTNTEAMVTTIWYLVSMPRPSASPSAVHQRIRALVTAFQHKAAQAAAQNVSKVLWLYWFSPAL